MNAVPAPLPKDESSTTVFSFSDQPLDQGCNDPTIEKIKKKKRKVCCCYKSRKSCCLWSIGITIGVILSLVLIAYFLWPRVPFAEVQPIQTEPGKVLNFNQTEEPIAALRKASPATPFGAWANFVAPIKIKSDNYITLHFAYANINIVIQTASGPLPIVYISGKVNDGYVYGRSESIVPVNMTMGVFVVKPISSTNRNEELDALAKLCTTPQDSLQVSYSIQFSLNILSWLGIYPIIKGVKSVDCPPALVSLTDLLRQASEGN